MKVLITGGAGFIGSTIARRLLTEGHSVRIFDNLETGSIENVPLGAEFVEGDVQLGVETSRGVHQAAPARPCARSRDVSQAQASCRMPRTSCHCRFDSPCRSCHCSRSSHSQVSSRSGP